MTVTEIHLASIPSGMPTLDNFKSVQIDLPSPKDGEITVKNLYMSVDPYMRGRMTGVKSYADPYKVGAVMTGGAVGEIVDSAHPDYKVGDHVLSMRGWREGFTASVDAMIPEGFRKIDTRNIPIQAYLGVAGMPGLTAYAGLYAVGQYKAGETVLVSGAAGAVGSTVCQLAKADGAFVVGLAGSDSKCDWLESHGVDVAINYKTCGDLTKAIQKAAPQGVDVYFENVGGKTLEAAINVLNPFGRIAACGMIADYNATTPPTGPNNMIQIVGKSLQIKGFIVIEHVGLMPDYIQKLTTLMPTGQLVQQETILDGIDKAGEAFLRLFSGDKQGKMLVKLT